VRRDGVVDHLWIRVGDLAAAHAWYEAGGSAAGWRPRAVDDGTRVQVEPVAGRGTFALVADGRPVTEHAHLAVFMAGQSAAAVERDPDGNRVELLAPGPVT
jgi:catechol 2,3-dioxygenase-like lactoylglutathione lyase family enzyme